MLVTLGSCFRCDASNMKAITCKHPWLGLGLAVMTMSGCAANEQALPLKPMGPVTTVPRHAAHGGFLIVYTPIEEPRVFPDTMYAPHRGYEIFDSRGNLVRTVLNHVGAWDESPDLVTLPPGRYTVKAESATGNSLVVPVIVKADRPTSVNLEWREPKFVANP